MNPAHDKKQDKKNLRTEFRKRIDAISFGDLITKSQNLVESFQANIAQTISSSVFSGRYIVSFYPFENEPQINIESEARNEPYQVAYVRITSWDQREMVAAQARRDQPGQWEEFEVAPGNRIFQPSPGQPLCSPSEIAAVLIPGLSFSPGGERLGRGAGFYDRFLKNYPMALRIGIAFEEQISQNLPCDEWDEKVDVILTDRGIREVKGMNLLGEWRTQGKILERKQD